MTDFLIQIFPYVIGLLGVAASFYTIHKTIDHQREMTIVEIKKELRIKQLDDFIYTYCELIKRYSELGTFIPDLDFTSTKEEIKLARSNIFEVVTQINYYTAKMQMLLSKESETNLKIILKIKVILMLVIQASVSKPSSELTNGENSLTKELEKEKNEFMLICSAYVEKERTDLESLITSDKKNILVKWLIKSWREVGEYKA